MTDLEIVREFIARITTAIAGTINCGVTISWEERQWLMDAVFPALAALSRLEAQQQNDRMTGAWRCSECGDMQDVSDPRWRWNGEAWEHKCGHPQAGHFPARYFGEAQQSPGEQSKCECWYNPETAMEERCAKHLYPAEELPPDGGSGVDS